MDEAGIDTILVGDSLGMTMQGYADTIPVTMEDMIVYGRSVCRACQNAFVVLDMPFMSYQVSVEQAVTNAGRLMKECGANAVSWREARRSATGSGPSPPAGFPSAPMWGLTPSPITPWAALRSRARARLRPAGCWKTPWPWRPPGPSWWCWNVCPQAGRVDYQKTSMITIGIGAGNGCDGQVLVWQDMMGMSPEPPSSCGTSARWARPSRRPAGHTTKR